MTSKRPADSSRRSVATADGVVARFDTAPFIGNPVLRPSGTTYAGSSRSWGQAPRCSRADRRSCGSYGARTRTWWPSAENCSARASMCRVTPPGYVHEYGDTRAIRIAKMLSPGPYRLGSGSRTLQRILPRRLGLLREARIAAHVRGDDAERGDAEEQE